MTCPYVQAGLAIPLAHVIVQQTLMILVLTMIMLTMSGLRTLQATCWGSPPRPGGGDSLAGSSGAARHQLPAAPG